MTLDERPMSASRRRVWVLMDHEAVPPHLRERSVDLALVALLPRELESLLGERAVRLASAEDESVAALVARGVPTPELARHLSISRRTAYRRVARLKKQVGARSHPELVARLSELGF